MFLSRDQYEHRLPFVRRTAMRLARKAPSVSVGDLVGSGFVGLVDGLAHADPEAPEAQRDAYLNYRIRGAMLDFVRSCQDRTHEVWTESRRMVRAIGILERRLGRAPEESEIAEALDLSRTDYRARLRAIGATGHLPLESVSLDPADDKDLLDDGEDNDVPAAKPGLDGALAEGIAKLPTMQQHVLALHHQEGCTPLEIAMVLDVDEDRVTELHVEAVHRLRAHLESRRDAR